MPGLNPKDELIHRLTTILAEEDIEDIQTVKFKMQAILADYDVSPAEHALVPLTEGVNDRYLKLFLVAKSVAGRTKKTIENYRGLIGRALRDIGKDADKITHVDIQLYLAGIMSRSTKVNARNNQRVLSSFFRWMASEEFIAKNPMIRVEPIKVPKVKKKAFTEMEVEKLRDACETRRERAIVETLLSTGCRVSELCDIKLSRIDSGSVVIMGKGQKERTVFLTAKAELAIKDYVENERHGDGDALFAPIKDAGREDLGVGTVEAIVREIGARAGVENTHPHRFRRTCATLALRRGMSLADVSKMLGHETVATTQIYLDIEDDDLHNAHRKYVSF